MLLFGINLNVEVRGKTCFYRILAGIIETFIVWLSFPNPYIIDKSLYKGRSVYKICACACEYLNLWRTFYRKIDK